ncbi:MAG: hypothetical protein UW46_C0004G0065 [Candidatus Yanofskybacteria bacterium GW2011_GWF1_44_227]|uniref:Winged helix DNA-binding domain-containing protein n=1 Tax=Candidatus Yanofskybacteria bacterium GW2011_GWE2_40_11 TaxID=1619033 RepID=A0A0G0T0H2_9BACT|nr:MAG: hypothetical protein UT75_C0007G0038 [Candidatus Yanofskybacteria bacterium GW2011_GWE2_40_11]KKT15612.1 MAG: hypothetical protein UV97_C0004G0028 [Candidatus Yanofskybacteria bacterium GW2011_GWF2_43_596]KKT53338.1 MAG: hypothetical protein UW46_C0004G0065 [Candidatus Yanofskybacteria bacterium GW2011_GWF1_44_227]OGN35966.1 MAG: hypothetical protein A2207_02815 [Candidatus Yanofskybacteria bacterium RIFOXYA1_FULL_44_17]OGN36432.1 MAG: hypothetical protein A2241_01670 [Candidatus Yanofs
MKLYDIAMLRMYNQRIVGDKFNRPEEVVRHLGAIQAQDYQSALWAIGLRMKKADKADVERALAEGKIVRTWPMRGTLHFVATEDAHWMMDLLVSKNIRAAALRGDKRFGLNDNVINQCKRVIQKALRGGKSLSRPELYQVLERQDIDTKNSRGLHILGRLALEKVICFGPRKDKQQVFVLFDEWISESKKLSRDESLAKLAIRYFTGHGPAQIKDLAWWSGLSIKDIGVGIELAGPELVKEVADGKTYWMAPKQSRVVKSNTAYLLPAFDEFLVAYRDRSASLEAIHAKHINPGANGMLSPVIVINGQVLGTWKRITKRGMIDIELKPFAQLATDQMKSIDKEKEAYLKFLNL